MDAQLSNNLSRGLSAVATTFGQYAMAEHEERIQAAKQQFEQMLSDKKENAEDARSAANEAQKAKDRAAETELAREQHAQDKAQQQSQFDISKSQQDRQFAETRAQEAQRIAIEQEAADRAAKAAGGDKPLTTEQKLDHMDKMADGWTKQADRENAKLTKLQADPMYQAGDPNAQKAVAAQQQIVNAAQAHADAYGAARDKAAQGAGINLPSQTTPTAPATGAGVQVVKDAKGNFYQTSPGGTPTPITPQQARDLYNQSKSGSGTPGSSSTPSASTPASGDDDSGDDSASTTPDASSTGPAATAGAYAQSQPQPAVAPDPSNATPQVGQPDPNNPTLAS